MISVLVTVIATWIESRSLKESTLVYLMTKMTANNRWIPYMHLMTKRDCDLNINFGELNYEIPFLTHAIGLQSKVLFEFSDNTLN
jgi:hypothetical protein